jgi:hypothetical protein
LPGRCLADDLLRGNLPPSPSHDWTPPPLREHQAGVSQTHKEWQSLVVCKNSECEKNMARNVICRNLEPSETAAQSASEELKTTQNVFLSHLKADSRSVVDPVASVRQGF